MSKQQQPPLLAWHWLTPDRILANDDGRPVVVGETLTVDTSLHPLEFCHYGLHASVRAIDSLQHAPGAIICRVRLGGEILAPVGENKVCASERTVLWMADATTVLHEFAVWCAEQALQGERSQGREPNPRSWAALEAKRRWLKGEITDEELTAAGSAAGSAARAAAGSAAGSAAWSAARAAAWSAARAAAWSAARAAAGAAAGAAAWNAAGAAAWSVAGAAAWSVAWNAARAGAAAGSAARTAAGAAQNAELERRLITLAG